MKELKGIFHQTANGYDSYEIYDADASFIYKIATVVEGLFHFTSTNPIIELEGIFMDFVKDEVRLTIGWDIWSGCFLMAYDQAGVTYVREIGSYLDKHLNML